MPLKAPFNAGYQISKTITPVEQGIKGKYTRGDVLRITFSIKASADMTWVVISDPVPGGATILGSGLGRDSQIAISSEKKTALSALLNVSAVRTLVMVSPDAFHKQLRAIGLPLRESGDYYGYSLALGSAELSLLSLTNAYRTLANGGRYSTTSLAKQTKPAFKPALDPRAAFIVTAILADPLARALTSGTDSILTTRFWTAVKTGTSKDMRDNWAMGVSQRYILDVWVRNASGALVWAALMN